jgi:hypothetical protein
MTRAAIVSCLAVLAAHTLIAQNPPVASNPTPRDTGDYAFWREMPDVAQVIKDIQGKDEEETSARGLAAFRVLDALINANADRIGRLPWPPREIELVHAYNQLIYKRPQRVRTARDRRIMVRSNRFQGDTAFTRPFLRHYFSPVAMRAAEPVFRNAEESGRLEYAEEILDNAMTGDAPEIEAPARPWVGPPGPPNGRVASDFVRANVGSHWLKTANGWTTRLEMRTMTGDVVPNGIAGYLQYRDLAFTIEPEELSDAQRLDGVEYHGKVKFEQAPVRFFRAFESYNRPKGWSEWSDIGFIPPFAVERKKGQWVIDDNVLFTGAKPDAAAVPQG